MVVLVVVDVMTSCCILVVEFESFSPINSHNKLIININKLITQSIFNYYYIFLLILLTSVNQESIFDGGFSAVLAWCVVTFLLYVMMSGVKTWNELYIIKYSTLFFI